MRQIILDTETTGLEPKLGLPAIDHHCDAVVDTLTMAREMHPGQRNSLDALCKRYGIDNSNRTLHGALLDCELLGAVYLAMTRGQESLMMSMTDAQSGQSGTRAGHVRPRPLLVVVPEPELTGHHALLEAINRESKGACLWLASGSELDQGVSN